ncbi:MAG: hypothetical protein LBL69_06385 [Zoogloeaceae bacterium]|nr:hypothetical protein [Zoogloeaceae bacterium]
MTPQVPSFRFGRTLGLALLITLLLMTLAAVGWHVRTLSVSVDNVAERQLPSVWKLGQLYIECLSARADLLSLFALEGPTASTTARLQDIQQHRQERIEHIHALMEELRELSAQPDVPEKSRPEFSRLENDLAAWRTHYEAFATSIQHFIDASTQKDRRAFAEARRDLGLLYAGFPGVARTLAEAINACRDAAIHRAAQAALTAVHQAVLSSVFLLALVLAALILGWQLGRAQSLRRQDKTPPPQIAPTPARHEPPLPRHE